MINEKSNNFSKRGHLENYDEKFKDRGRR